MLNRDGTIGADTRPFLPASYDFANGHLQGNICTDQAEWIPAAQMSTDAKHLKQIRTLADAEFGKFLMWQILNLKGPK